LSSEAAPAEDQPHDPDLKSGTVLFYFNNSKHDGVKSMEYGFIKPDGVGKNIFVHRNDIKTPIDVSSREIRPAFSLKDRVQFKVDVVESGDDEKISLIAREVTLEGGKLLQPFEKGYLSRYIKHQKTMFGVKVYNAMYSVSDEIDMEKIIVDSFVKTNTNIAREKARVKMIEEIYAKENL
jgi:hypothetical protein